MYVSEASNRAIEASEECAARASSTREDAPSNRIASIARFSSTVPTQADTRSTISSRLSVPARKNPLAIGDQTRRQPSRPPPDLALAVPSHSTIAMSRIDVDIRINSTRALPLPTQNNKHDNIRKVYMVVQMCSAREKRMV